MRAKLKFEIDSGLKGSNVLRRYLDVPRFVNFLKTSALYLCRSDLFPDKFERSFTPSLRDAISIAYTKNEIEYTYDKFKKELREGVFINCWSLGADDNMALWHLFGKTNDCVAITTTVDKLKAALNAFTGDGHISIRKVDYIRHWNDPDIDINPYSKIFRYKTVGYGFEKEVRVILDRFRSTFEADEKAEGISVSLDLNSFLRSIVVSSECSAWFRAVVEDLTKKYRVSCSVRNSRMAKEPI